MYGLKKVTLESQVLKIHLDFTPVSAQVSKQQHAKKTKAQLSFQAN